MNVTTQTHIDMPNADNDAFLRMIKCARSRDASRGVVFSARSHAKDGAGFKEESVRRRKEPTRHFERALLKTELFAAFRHNEITGNECHYCSVI